MALARPESLSISSMPLSNGFGFDSIQTAHSETTFRPSSGTSTTSSGAARESGPTMIVAPKPLATIVIRLHWLTRCNWIRRRARFRHLPDQVVMNVRSQAAGTQDEALMAKVIELQPFRAGQRVGFREHDCHLLVPEEKGPRRDAIAGFDDECDIHLALLNQCETCVCRAFDHLDGYACIPLPERLKGLPEKDERYAHHDRQLPLFAAVQGAGPLHGPSQMVESEVCLVDEALAGRSEPNAGVMALEQIRADPMFEVSDTLADGRGPDIQGLRRAPKASVLGRSQRKTE